jgi:hypothetical protein
MIIARAAGCFSPRFSTVLRMGLRSEHESDDTRRGEWRSNGRAAAARGDVGAAAQNIEHVARDFLLQTMATGRPLRAVLGRQSQQGKDRGHGKMELRREGRCAGRRPEVEEGVRHPSCWRPWRGCWPPCASEVSRQLKLPSRG